MIPHRRYRKEALFPLMKQKKSDPPAISCSDRSASLDNSMIIHHHHHHHDSETNSLHHGVLLDKSSKDCSFKDNNHNDYDDYYPEKDKKRRYGWALCYRLFASSTWRRVTSFLFVVFCLLHQVAVIGKENRILRLRLQKLEGTSSTTVSSSNVVGSKLSAAGTPFSIIDMETANDAPPIIPDTPPPNLLLYQDQFDNEVIQMTGEHLPQRTLENMDTLGSNYSSCGTVPSEDHLATTLVLQTSIDRLWILNETCSRWKDPIVAVVFVPYPTTTPADVPASPFGEATLATTNGASSSTTTTATMASSTNDDLTLPLDLNLTACKGHLQLIQYSGTPEESIASNYPVNRLRNVGLDAVVTSHILVMDVDFVPSRDLSDTIRKALKQQQIQQEEEELRIRYNMGRPDELHYYQHTAIVVPAFERIPPKRCATKMECAAHLKADSSFIPSNFADLQQCYHQESCIVFDRNVNWRGHYSTRSEAWLRRKWYDYENKLNSLPCFHTERYEPYVVLRWCHTTSSAAAASTTKSTVSSSAPLNNNSTDPAVEGEEKPQPVVQRQGPLAPYYDERFRGYGKNKIELISHLRKSGYRFSVLPEGFVVHNPHKHSSAKQTWNARKSSNLRQTMDTLYEEFLSELDIKYDHVQNKTTKVCNYFQRSVAYLSVKANEVAAAAFPET